MKHSSASIITHFVDWGGGRGEGRRDWGGDTGLFETSYDVESLFFGSATLL